jgi:DNA polymerase III alpha subunit
MSKNIIPIFSTDASIGKSIIITDEAGEIKENTPVSVFSIAKEYNLDPIVILDTSMVSFIPCYKNAEKLKKQLIFGVKFKIVGNSKDQSEDSLDTVHCVNIFMKNSDGYRDLIKLYSAINADKTRFYYYGRGDFKLLQEYWTDNLLMTVPFYSSFISNNSLNYGSRCVPEFGGIKPTFILEEHNLPFDNQLREKTIRYADENKYDILEGHSIYYYQKKDLKAYQTFRAIHERTSYEMPELRFFSQPTFSFESWQERTNG